MVDADDGAGPRGPLDGISGGLGSKYTVLSLVVILFLSFALYNSVELIIMILLSFKRFRGLYFWSLVVSVVFGVIPYSTGFLLKFFTDTNRWISVTILTIGWWVMVTGQALVLYSRLHLVLRDQRRLQHVVYMIFTSVIIFHLPTTILTYGSNVHHTGSSRRWVTGYNIMEKIQLTGFSIQEAIISGLYLYETARLLRLANNPRSHRRIQYQLIGINVLIIFMDLVLLGFEYASEYAVQTTLKAAVYSLKLKLEFAVLGKLVDFIRTNRDNSSGMPMGSSARRYAGQGAGLPSTFANDRHFYGQSTATVMRPERTNSSQEQLNLPSGIIVAKTEFSTTIDKRDETSLQMDDSD
jgi:hypothetical protein